MRNVVVVRNGQGCWKSVSKSVLKKIYWTYIKTSRPNQMEKILERIEGKKNRKLAAVKTEITD